MAAFQLAQRQNEDAHAPMSGMSHDMHSNMAMRSLPNEVSFPYGFPSPGQYRIFVQMKHGGTVETGIFDAAAH